MLRYLLMSSNRELIDAEKDLLLKNAVYVLLCNADPNVDNWHIQKEGVYTLSDLNIYCTINGIEVDIKRLVHEINCGFENRVKEATEQVVRTRLAGLINSLTAIEDAIAETEEQARLANIYFGW
jgi:hypothetical protein